MPYGKALHDRSIRPEIAILSVGDLQLAAAGVKGGKHHPGHKEHVSGVKKPVSETRARGAWQIHISRVAKISPGLSGPNLPFPSGPRQQRDRCHEEQEITP